MRRSIRVSTLLKDVTNPRQLSPFPNGKLNEEESGDADSRPRLTGSTDSSSGLKTPNFFDSDYTPRRCLLSAFEEEVEKELCSVAETSAVSLTAHTGETPGPSRGREVRSMKGVRAFVDVGAPFDVNDLKRSLESLGATVKARFMKDVTHLVFWNGLQDVLDKAHEKGFSPVIIAPHWVKKCVEEGKHVDEKSYLLYGLTGLALPHAEMAKGRLGRITEPTTDSARKRSAVIGALERSSSKRSCQRSRQRRPAKDNVKDSAADSLLDGSGLLYTIETLSDQLAPVLASLELSGLAVADVISPIFDRVKQRVHEISNSGIMLTPTTAEAFAAASYNAPDKESSHESNKRAPPLFGSPETDSEKLPRSVLSEGENHSLSLAITDASQRFRTGTCSLPTSRSRLNWTTVEADLGGSQHSPTPSESNRFSKAALVNLTRSEPAKRRGRPWLPAEQMTPLQFERAMIRRCPKSYRSHLKLNAEERDAAYREYLQQESQEQPRTAEAEIPEEKENKPRAFTVRTRSRVLNDLQVVNSSDEFVRARPKLRHVPRKPGNVVLSAVAESDRDFLYAIVRRLGILRVMKNVDDETRFVIGDDDGSRTVNVMHALATGIPVVSKEWAYRSLDNMSWLSAQEFIIPRWKIAYKAYRRGRLPHLFSSLGPFYISNRCSPPADHLTSWIEKCGGKVTESLSRATIFIAPRSLWKGLIARHRNDQDFVRTLPARWVLDSITGCKICSFEEYQSDEAEEDLSDHEEEKSDVTAEHSNLDEESSTDYMDCSETEMQQKK